MDWVGAFRLILTSLLGPHRQLLSDFWDNQEGSPSPLLLGLEDVAEDVVSDVEHVVATRLQHLADHVARAARVDLPLLRRTHVPTDLEGTRFLSELRVKAKGCEGYTSVKKQNKTKRKWL